MTDAELNAWERQPSVLNILTSKEFGEWFHRRDKNKEKHGEWLVDKYNAEFCSVCGKHPYNDGEYYVVGWYSDFCPHCGADMRKGETK